MTNFDRAIAIVLREECGPGPDATGLVDNPGDPGGLTKYGISQRAFPKVDIRNLTRDAAVEIYRCDYWAVAHCDEIPWPLCLFVFDHAVNAGVGGAIRLLQGVCGGKVDGAWGPLTAEAVAGRCARAPMFELGRSYNVARVQAYLGMSPMLVSRFGVGWCGRVAAVALAAYSAGAPSQ